MINVDNLKKTYYMGNQSLDALSGVTFEITKGEYVAIMGPSGSGKSTLMNIIYGLYQPSSGEILVRGKSSKMRSPRDAIGLGIGMVHQHFQLVPVMTVVENVMLGSEMLRHGFLDRDRFASGYWIFPGITSWK